MEANDVLLETPHWKVVLSRKQAYVCRAVIVLSRPCPNLSELREEEWADLHQVIVHYESCMKDCFGADLLNWSCLMNNAYREAIPNPQVHWHARPRFSRPVRIGGKEYRDPNFANHYDISLDAEEVPDTPIDERMRIATAIREALHGLA